MNKNLKYIFLGSGPLAESALYSLYKDDLIPEIIITNQDKRSGRGLEVHKNIISEWANLKNIKCSQPESLRTLEDLKDILKENNVETDLDFFLVVSYPKILKKEIIEYPKKGTLNIHPSLLPKYRGPSPIQTSLINGDTITGVSIIKLDEDIDHGPILISKEVEIMDDETNEKLERRLGAIGGDMLSSIIEHYIDDTLTLKEQDHNLATHTQKFDKSQGEIKLEDKAFELQNKFKALLPHIPIYFFVSHKDKDIRVKISEIIMNKTLTKDILAKDIILKVIPEGKSEMDFKDFERGYLK